MMPVNVLIVDDSAVMRSMIIRSLRLGGIPLGTIHEAGNGVEALAVLADHTVDLALVDINMPIMGGEVLVDRIRENPETVGLPVIVVSTEGSKTRIEWLVEHGVGFVRKPFTPAALRDRVRKIIGVSNEPPNEQSIVRSDGPDF
jgi:two-component system chemotaxis response regulator CheY